MKTDKIKSSFTPSNLNKKTAAGLEKLDRKFVQTSKKAKKDLIAKELKIDYFGNPTVHQIKISEIFSPPGFTRHNHSNPFEDLDALNNPEPLKVVSAESIKGFFVIDGQRRLEFQKRSGKKQIKALIVGQVVCRSQIVMARALEMTRFKKPPNTPELVQGLLSLYEIIINDFGEEAFFTHGGNRKSGTKGKQSLSQYIASVLELKTSTVNALLNFGHHVGPYGLAGLHYHEDMQKLSIRTINQINARLKKEDLSKKISEMFHTLRDAKTTEAELIKACGNLAQNIIWANITAMAELKDSKGDKKDEGDEEFEHLELDPFDYDLPPEADKKPKGSEAGMNNSDNDADDNETEGGDDEDICLNPEDEIKEALKILKRFKYLLPRFEKALRNINQLEKTVQNNLGEDLKKFNENAENMISFITKKITDIKLGS
jgi:hypothetical protein